ncbi:MAG: winged helix-turn-helix domain-containing protein [Acidobacteria bacterium]|nr:winged helix-turn-helix domain-containing protein [Acidobacteriota bacterium]MCA1638908.1 winged helix-turn-helix domain-containing protein [Acidobacteriota bacterium]
MLNENLIATLEQSLRQTRNAQNRLLGRLREVETEADSLRQEIEALENSAAQTGEAIYSLLATMGTGNKSWKVKKHAEYNGEKNDDYNLELEAKRYGRANSNNQNKPSLNNQNSPSNNNYRNNPVAYINNSRNVPSINPGFEPISNRFTDRTITQACTLLLREATSPLHVNELYNLLVAGGFEFKGNNPTISIAVSLNRNRRRFRKVAPGTFDLVMRDVSQRDSSQAVS